GFAITPGCLRGEISLMWKCRHLAVSAGCTGAVLPHARVCVGAELLLGPPCQRHGPTICLRHEGPSRSSAPTQERAGLTAYNPKILRAFAPRTATRWSAGNASTRARQPFMSPMLCG